ncbi:MAG: hypothetical protein IPG61_02135 [bacterium]|nr:hypothetical protein [bacterium]
MAISATEFRDTVRDRLLGLLWRQWSAIGVAGYSESVETRIVDPEALLLLTLTVGRYDARLYDAVLEWLDLNADYLNVQRLQNLAPSFGPHARAGLGAIAERLGRRSAVALKWKKLAALPGLAQEEPLFLLADGSAMPLPAAHDEVFRKHGLLRAPITTRGVAQPFPNEGMPSLLLRLRALFGVSIRCEILCLLGSTSEIHPSLIARQIGQAPRTVQDVLVDMVRSGVCRCGPAPARNTMRWSPALSMTCCDRKVGHHGPTPCHCSGHSRRSGWGCPIRGSGICPLRCSRHSGDARRSRSGRC